MAKQNANTSAFKQVIELSNSGERFPVMSLVRDDPQLAAVISKLIPSRDPAQYGNDGNRQPTQPNVGLFQSTSERTAQSITDAKTVMQILPDMELAAQILVSSIIAPKDMTTTELTYNSAEGLLPPEVNSAMMARARQHFEQVYKIKPLLAKMLRDILFETGSYAVAVIPENSIDELINSQDRVTMEGLSEHIKSDGSVKPIGLLGPAVLAKPSAERTAPGLVMEGLYSFDPVQEVESKVTFESILPTPVQDSFLTVTDNSSLLKIPELNQKLREQRIVKSLRSTALEGITNKLNDREMTSLVYKDRQFAYKPIASMKTQEQLHRRTVGNPLILHLPSEAVIPVYVPGNVEQQIGFFILIDADGNPVCKTTDTDHYQQLSSRLNTNGSFPSAMLTKVKSMMSGFDLSNRDHLDYSARAYGNMVEQDLLSRLRNGVYGNGVALARKEEVYRIMLGRALAKQHTQLLFMPVELMTYMAFSFNHNGVGTSLLEDMKILNSLRAMLLFANVMASLKNSIGRTEVKLKLDESDPNPQKTIEIAQHEIVRSRQQYFPLGMNSPTDLTDWLQRSGFEFTYEGHPGLPDVAVDFGEKASNYVKPDTDLSDSLRKQAIMAVGLSPETVDATFNTEFAASVVSNNLLLAKRVIQLQDQFTPQLSDHMRKAMMNSEELIRDLTEILMTNFDKLPVEEDERAKANRLSSANGSEQKSTDVKENERAKRYMVTQFLREFIMNFEVNLPKPNSVTLENQLAALEVYSKGLDVTLDAYISDKFFTSSTGGEVAGQVETAKEMVKAHFIRQWLAENGVMTELSNLTTQDSEGKAIVNVFEMQKNHIEALSKSLTDMLVSLQPVIKASDKIIEEKVGALPQEEPMSDSSGSSDGGFGGFGGDDDIPSLTDMPTVDNVSTTGSSTETETGLDDDVPADAEAASKTETDTTETPPAADPDTEADPQK